MKNFDEITNEDGDVNQFLPNINLITETFDQEQLPPRKRIKLEKQNMFWIDKTKEAPEYLSLKSGKNLTSNEQDSCTFSSDSYSCEIMNEPLSPNTSELVTLPKEKSYFGRREQQMKKLQLETKTTSKNGNSMLTPKVYKRCILYPPQNGIIPKLEQPPACKTVIIAGLPHNLNTGTVRQIFKDCGKIQHIYRIKKGVFQITYSCQIGVDNVVRLNSYKVVGTVKNIPFVGTIEVEFAPIWLEKHEFTRQKSSHPYYSKKAVAKLIHDLEKDTMVKESVNVLVFWLEVGKCTKKNYLHFFLVLQALHGVVSRCISDQKRFEEFVSQNYCSQILKAFTLACFETFLDNLYQFKNQVVKWKKYIEEINGCKSWDAISAFKTTKLDLESPAQQESITSKSLSKILYSKCTKQAIKKLIEGLEQDCFCKKSLNVLVLWMKEGRCTNNTCYKYFFALKTMHGFISRFITEPTKFEELVRQGYCGRILKAFEVACSETVINNFKSSDKQNKIKSWKKYIEKVNKCKSWKAISAFAKRETEQKIVESENLLSGMERPNKELKAAQTKNCNPNNETGNPNNESDILSNETENHSNENDIQNINNGTVIYTNENYLQANDTCNHPNENDFQNNETISHKNETGNLNNENGIKKNETGNHNNENDFQNNENDDNQIDTGVKIVGKEARLIAALGAFLNLYSIGASIETICKYLLQIDPTTTCQGIEGLMRKFPTVFKEELTSDGSSKTKWTILGL